MSSVKVTRISLASLGWRPPFRPKDWREGDGVPRQRLVFDHQGRLLVGFTVRGGNRGLDLRGHPGLVFNVVRLTAAGTSDLTLEIPTDRWMGNGVYLDNHGDIVVLADDKLQMLARPPTGTTGAGAWRTLAPCAPCIVSQSPSRRTFQILTNLRAREPVAIIDMNNSSLVEHCRLPRGFLSVEISDRFDYETLWRSVWGPHPGLYRWQLCGDQGAIRLPTETDGRQIPTPLADGSVLLEPFSGAYSGPVPLYTADGRLERRLPLPLGSDESAWLLESLNGKRMAGVAYKFVPANPMQHVPVRVTAKRVLVLAMPDGQVLASVPVPIELPLNRFAISPDGRRVATLLNGVVTIIDVP